MADRIDESHALALAALTGPVVALYTALGMAPLFVTVGIAALALGRHRQPWRHVWKPGAVALAGIMAWMAVSMAWTIELPQSLITLPRLIAMTAGGLVLTALASRLEAEGRARVRLALATGLTLALGLAAIEIYLHGPGGMMFHRHHPWFDNYIPRLDRGLTVFSLLVVPAMVAAWRRGFRLWSGIILVLAVMVFAGGQTLSAKLALALMPAVFLVALRWPRATGAGMSGVMAVTILAFPLLALAPAPQATSDALPFLPNSAHHRLTIWIFAAGKVLEHPVRGWGLEASRSIPGGEDEVVVTRPSTARSSGWEPVTEQFLPLHPHNSPGQVWLELGGIGAILACGLMVVLGRVIAAAPNRVDAAMIAASASAAFIVACISYGVWQSWWIGSLWLTAALATAVATRREELSPR